MSRLRQAERKALSSNRAKSTRSQELRIGAQANLKDPAREAFDTEGTSRRANAFQRIPALARRAEPSVRPVVQPEKRHIHRGKCTLGVSRSANASRPGSVSEAPATKTPGKLDRAVSTATAALLTLLFCITTTSAQDLENLTFFPTRTGKPTPDLTQSPAAAKADKLIAQRQREAKRRRNEAIKRLTAFVTQEQEQAPEMPDALMRLAELTWENARARYLEDFETWQKTNTKVRATHPPTPDSSEALALYDRILTRHKTFNRTDLVLYMKAYALMETGQMGEALQQYQRILDEFPDSRFRPDAHMAFAESHFNGNHDFAAALKRYEEVLKYPDSELADLALFKSAWCLWKLGDVQSAARRFREVLDLDGKLARGSAERKRRLMSLQDEALEYLIQVFTEDERNSAADLQRFLTSIGGERYAGRVLARLSRTYYDQARYARAAEAYRMLIQHDPGDPHAPEYQRRIALSYAALEDPEHTLVELKLLAHNYGPSSDWAKQQSDPEVVRKAQRDSEKALRKQAMVYHERAQKEGQKADFEHAADLYRVHTETFGDSPESYEVTFFLAEILYHRLNKPAEAGDYYLSAAHKNPQGKHTKDALYNAVLAFESVRTKELEHCTPDASAKAAEPDANAPPDPCSETPLDHKFSDAVALYIKQYPNDPEVPGILFRQGRLYFDRGIYDPAIRQFGQLIDSYPNSEFVASAGELVLESFNRAKDYANIERWARKLKASPAFQSSESQQKLAALILQSVFKTGEQLARRGEHAQAAEAYRRAAAEFPKDERAPKALYNAGREWQRAGDLEAAAESYDSLIEQHPGSAEGALGAWAGAEMFESIAQFQDAARFYESYATHFASAPKREDALYNALVLRVAAGDSDGAVRIGRELRRQFPNASSSEDAYFLIGKAYEAKQRYREAADTYRLYLKSGKNLERKVEAQTRLGNMLLAQGDAAGADKAWSSAAKDGQRVQAPSARYFAAQARFQQGDRALAAFEKVAVEGDAAGLGKRLAHKSELLRKAAEIYSDVVSYRVSEWMTAALYKIGRSYELFAESLREVSVPPKLSEQEEQTYRDELAKFIVPIEERALEAYENGYRKALELHVYNTWTEKQRQALTRLNDVEYPPLREAGTELSDALPLPLPAPLTELRRTRDGKEEPPQDQENEKAGDRKKLKPKSKAAKPATSQRTHRRASRVFAWVAPSREALRPEDVPHASRSAISVSVSTPATGALGQRSRL
jgi:TolA-binding protein